MCKRMVESHGGKITVSTLEGKGSTFTVVLPIKGLENKLAPETSGYMV
jgi:signal transduction histidine kinase